ncbi:ATP phosphoribosyltransferase [Thermithiobacillus plumbiphilus]|uniref:ATP phosphoribosyltransferase n=1 Tax=Thermithiobacillus plumbiphilus TaxID=1729899 RepID=A0ABU9D7X1_9PROT
MKDPITIALSKGRIFKEALPLLAAADIHPLDDPEQSRKLILDTNRPEVRLVIIRATDVPTYVEYGAADLGIAGRDVLLEQHTVDLYEPLDLGIGRCRMVVAEPAGLAAQDDPAVWERVRIATKYPHITRTHFARKGIQTEIIKLYGSMELAPLVGLSDRIVDLVSTGVTLRENGLVEVEHITDISSRLVVNKAAMKLKHRSIHALIQHLEKKVRYDPA